MDLSINLATTADSWKIVKRAEAWGYRAAWFFDTQMLNADPFVAMTAAALNTAKIRLGTGVLVPANRIAPVAACALASVNAFAPGRIDFGIGTGFTARRAMGQDAVSLDSLAEYARNVQGLLAGATVEWKSEGATHKIRFLNPEIGAVNIADPIPLHISAFGPKGRRITAELGAGWIVSVRNVEGAQAAMAEMRKSWQGAGRDVGELHATAIVSGCVLAEGEAIDGPRAKAQAGPAAAILFHNAAETGSDSGLGHQIPPPLKPALEKYRETWRAYRPEDARYLQNHRGHLMFLRPEEKDLISGDMIRAMTFTATAPELRERLRALRAAGFAQFSIQIRHGHPEMVEEWAELFAGV